MGRFHVGTPDEEIAAEIFQRCAMARNSAGLGNRERIQYTRLAMRYALQSHARNRAEYAIRYGRHAGACMIPAVKTLLGEIRGVVADLCTLLATTLECDDLPSVDRAALECTYELARRLVAYLEQL